MLILSKHHDYYDTVSKVAGIDKTILYKRKQVDIPHTDKRVADFLKIGNSFPYVAFPLNSGIKKLRGFIEGVGLPRSLMTTCVGFCGKTYKILKVTYFGKWELYGYNLVEKVYYEKQAVLELENLSNNFKAFRCSHVSKENWMNFQFSVDNFREFNTPVLLLQPHSHFPLVVNPVLSELYFQKVVDPFTAFQEIQMFISGVLGTEEKDTVQISDLHRLEAAGFDKKWSFRKPPKKARK